MISMTSELEGLLSLVWTITAHSVAILFGFS
jgi:hypothetical protein